MVKKGKRLMSKVNALARINRFSNAADFKRTFQFLLKKYRVPKEWNKPLYSALCHYNFSPNAKTNVKQIETYFRIFNALCKFKKSGKPDSFSEISNNLSLDEGKNNFEYAGRKAISNFNRFLGVVPEKQIFMQKGKGGFRKKISDKKRQKIIEEINKGGIPNKIGENNGVSGYFVYNLGVLEGLYNPKPNKRKGYRLPEKTEKQIKDLIALNWTISGIARELGIAKSTVWLRRNKKNK